MKDLLIGRLAINYAASKTNPAVNSALNPADLALGAIGVYALGVNGANAGKTILVTAALLPDIADDVLGAGIAKADIQYSFAQGTADGYISTKYYKAKEFVREYMKEYQAALNQVTYVGYNGSTGTLLGSVASTFDEATIDFAARFNQFMPEDEIKSISAGLVIGDTTYDIARKLANAINENAVSPDNAGARYAANVVADGFITGAIAFVGNVTFTNGSPVITVGTSHDVVVGNFLKVVLDAQTDLIPIPAVAPSLTNSVLFKVVAVTATTITLDRAWAGNTQTLIAADAITSVVKSLVSPTNFGLRLTPYPFQLNNEYLQFQIGLGGVIKGSLITYAQGINPGSGTLNHMQRLQKDAQIANGFWNTVDGYLYAGGKTPISYINGTTYDLYFFDVAPIVDTTVQSQKATHYYNAIVAFEDGVSGAGQNQTVFHSIVAGTDSIFGTALAPLPITVPFETGDALPSA